MANNPNNLTFYQFDYDDIEDNIRIEAKFRDEDESCIGSVLLDNMFYIWIEYNKKEGLIYFGSSVSSCEYKLKSHTIKESYDNMINSIIDNYSNYLLNKLKTL